MTVLFVSAHVHIGMVRASLAIVRQATRQDSQALRSCLLTRPVEVWHAQKTRGYKKYTIRCGLRSPRRGEWAVSSHPPFRMPVPRMNQLQQGSTVNIVLKADQPSGKLTTGTIADFLTHGDHPRGIKVRLSDGKIGRVQSVVSGHQPSTQISSTGNTPLQTLRSGAVAGHGLQQDYRTEEQPEEEASLLDYIKVKPAKKARAKRKVAETAVGAAPCETAPDSEAASLQQQMEAEFPNLDPALIAAIVSDHSSPDAARGVLAGLS